MIKVERGEQEKGEESMSPKTHKTKKSMKKRSFLERVIEALTGAFIVYISSLATIDLLRVLLFVGGIVAIIYAVVPD